MVSYGKPNVNTFLKIFFGLDSIEFHLKRERYKRSRYKTNTKRKDVNTWQIFAKCFRNQQL